VVNAQVNLQLGCQKAGQRMHSRKSSRRDILKGAASVSVAVITRGAQGQEKDSSATGTAKERLFYYIDGYHGGVDGHMPPDSLRNVLDGLDKFPNWKVSFEIEPYSWAVFAKSDPKSIERLAHHLADSSPAARVEIVSGCYGQAYMWNASGESNIRQIAFGLAELRAAFPDIVVDTYAVQEPCWTSCLPQLLKSFGYKRAVLKNSTCWGGYHAPTVDVDLIHWIGSDGTAITTVPRYTIEYLVPPATMAGAQPTPAFIDRGHEVGVEHPSGTTLQDMGWPGRPWHFGMNREAVSALKNVTWRQYVDTIASHPEKQWKASQEDLRVGLPWGGTILQRIAQVVRASENQLVQTEKLATMAYVRQGRPFPESELREAWKLLLWSQHHDVWIVSYNRHRDGTWASAADAKRDTINSTCQKIVGEATDSMEGVSEDKSGRGRFVRVFNSTGFRRRDLAAIQIDKGESLRVLDYQGHEVPSQIIRATASEAASLVFPAEVPSMGYETYELAVANGAPVARDSIVRAITNADGTVTLETDLYSISIDPARGGRISRLFAKDLPRDFVDSSGRRSFNEFRGYFPSEGKWLSSTDSPAQIELLEHGPLQAVVEIRGKIGEWPFVSRISVAAGQRRIDFHTTFDFPADTQPFNNRRRENGGSQPAKRFRVGQPWEATRNTVRSNERPFYDSSFKLQALFPVSLKQPTLDKNAPFDVCRSKTSDTRFNSWDSFKHNLIMNWVDLVEQDGSAGMAVMTDHLTAYSLSPGEPFGIVMAYAGGGIWHDYGLGRAPSVSYAVVPHAGDWAKARLWRELARWSEPLIAKRCAAPARDDSHWSLLDASDSGFETTTGFVENGTLTIRLFNAKGDEAPQRITLDRRIRHVQRVELDGRTIEDVPVERSASGEGVITVGMRRFAVQTLRCSLASA